MEIRRLNPQDAESYRELEPLAFTESIAEHQTMVLVSIQHRLGAGDSDDNFVLGAFDARRLIGMAGFFRRRGEKICHRGEIWGVYVSREHRAKGIGRALLEELVRQLHSQPGLEQVALGVSAGNIPARRLYEALGFEVYGCEARAVKIGDTYVDEILMFLYFR